MGGFGNALRGNAGQNSQSNTRLSEGDNIARIRAALQKEGAIVTGIGARDTPASELLLITAVGRRAEERGMRGRSGGAGGADLAFEKGFSDPRNIDVIFPWPNFLPTDMTEEDVNAYLGRVRPKSGPGAPVMLSGQYIKQAEKLAEKYHPKWSELSYGVKKLHSRNMPQVLGMELDTQSDVVIAWTADGKASRGTGQAIRIATDIGVPVANLKNPAERAVVMEVLGITDPAMEMRKAQMHQQLFGR